MNDQKRLSIICPVFNEEEALPLFHARLAAALADWRSTNELELIFTNNCSTDRTLELILELRAKDSSVHVLTLSRNFGYQASVLAGLEHASGDAMVVIDVDCEDPPELIPRFLTEWENGNDIVYGRRDGRPEHAAIQLLRKTFYRLNRFVGDSDIILDMAEFSLISAHVRDAMLANRSTFPFLRTEIAYVGFCRKAIPYNRQERVGGKTHYNLLSMTQFAIGGILSSSTFPLRLMVYLCIPLVVLNVVLALADIGASSPVAFRVMVAMDLIYLVSCGAVLCLYQSRVYKDGVGRPVFIVDWRRSTLSRPAPLARRESLRPVT